MQTYRTPGLTSMTPEPVLIRLTEALERVSGVSRVTLLPDTSEFELKVHAEQKPKLAEIMAAAASIGFKITVKKKSQT